MRRFLSVVTILLCACLEAAVPATKASDATQNNPPATVDIDALGPKVGESVPDFELPDQDGLPHSLKSLLGPKGAVLVFFRSADWCPYCKTQLVELQGRLSEIRKAGMNLVAVSYDPVPVLKDFAERRQISFPLLSDAGSATIKRYGILNTTIDPNNALYGYPFPGTFILDPKGIVRSRTFEPIYQERNTISSILVRLGGQIDAPAAKINGAHVDVTSYSTDQVAAPGTHFSLVLDVVPGPRVHVYAPGATGYKPVRIVLQPQPGVVVRNAQFPTAEDYFFQPLNEHVQVYQHPFRIVQDVMLDPSRDAAAVLNEAKSVTITGTFEYQACDDKVCFTPQSVPLSWTIAVKHLDLERARRR